MMGSPTLPRSHCHPEATAECSAQTGQPGPFAEKGTVSINNYLLRTYYGPNTDLDTRHTVVDKTDKYFCPHEAYILVCVRGEGRGRPTVNKTSK